MTVVKAGFQLQNYLGGRTLDMAVMPSIFLLVF